MPKGYNDETCAEAIQALFLEYPVLSASDIYSRVGQAGPWKDETLWQHMMWLIVNLPPARHHWKNAVPFLFLRPDGQYELHVDAKHPRAIE